MDAGFYTLIGAVLGATVGGFSTLRIQRSIQSDRFLVERRRARVDRLLNRLDECITAASTYWGGHGLAKKDRAMLSVSISRLVTHITGEIAQLREKYPSEMSKVTDLLQNDFLDEITGGDFDSSDVAEDPGRAQRAARFGERLWSSLQHAAD